MLSEVDGVEVKEYPSVFFGNLSTNVTRQELADLIAPVRIVKNYGRSKGFAFVTFETDADCLKVIAELDQKILDERPLAVQLATKKTRERVVKPEDSEAHSSATPNRIDDSLPIDVETKKKRKPKKKVVRVPAADVDIENKKVVVENGEKPVRKERAPRKERAVLDNILYVGNMPISVTEDNLYDLFKSDDAKKVKLVPGRADKICSYGYVEFATPDQAKFVLDKFQGALLDERNLKMAYARDNIKME